MDFNLIVNATHKSYPHGASVFNNRRSLVEHPFARLSRKSVNMHRFQVLWNVHKCADACPHMWIVTYEARWSVRVNVLYIVVTNYCVTWFLFGPMEKQAGVHDNAFGHLESVVLASVVLQLRLRPVQHKASRTKKFIKLSKCVLKYNLKWNKTVNNLQPVSYTHLDVYKRQLQDVSEPIFRVDRQVSTTGIC